MDRNERIKKAISLCWFGEMCCKTECPYAKQVDGICWFTEECIARLKQDILDMADEKEEE